MQRFTPTVEALFVPDIDASLDEQSAKTRVLERIQGARPLVGRAAAVLSGRAAALVALSALVGSATARVEPLPNVALWWDVAWLALVLIPAVFALVWLALPLRGRPGRWLALVAVALRRCSRSSSAGARTSTSLANFSSSPR